MIREIPIVIDAGEDYRNDYREIFPTLARIFRNYVGKDILTTGNLPSEAGEREERTRTYSAKKNSLVVKINLARTEPAWIKGEIYVSGKNEEEVIKLYSLLRIALPNNRTIFLDEDSFL